MWAANLEKGGALEMNSTQTILSIIARVRTVCGSGAALPCTGAPVASYT